MKKLKKAAARGKVKKKVIARKKKVSSKKKGTVMDTPKKRDSSLMDIICPICKPVEKFFTRDSFKTHLISVHGYDDNKHKHFEEYEDEDDSVLSLALTSTLLTHSDFGEVPDASPLGEFEGSGGSFGGAGASSSWDEPSTTTSETEASSTDSSDTSDSSSDSDSSSANDD
jgi:hypothetical protein